MIDAALFLYDLTGNMAKPWAEAGVECWCVDTQHSIRNDRKEGNVRYVWGDARSFRRPEGRRFVFAASFSPCTDVTNADARDFERKGGIMLRDAIEQFEAGRQVCSWTGAPYFCENPVGVLSSLPHIGKPDFYFHPWEYAGWCADDTYSKRTCLWVGKGFKMPKPRLVTHLLRDDKLDRLPPPDDRIFKARPSKDRKNDRAATPLGFAYAVFDANYTRPRARLRRVK